MAAESLSRRAFADHPQLWRVWSRGAAPTTAVIGRMLGGYLFVPVELALITGFYFVTNTYFGWWQPSESLSDPNIWAAPCRRWRRSAWRCRPGSWRSACSAPCRCRWRRSSARASAAGAAHRVPRSLLEALVFASAHANYPGFPAYSRLVELFVPALIWGLIFLRFGLLPTIILHGTFDLVLMSIRCFWCRGRARAQPRPGRRRPRSLRWRGVLAPRAGRALGCAAASLRNGGWRPADRVGRSPPRVGAPRAGVWTMRIQQALPLLAFAGRWSFSRRPLHGDVPPVRIGRAQAEAIADAALKERGIELGADGDAPPRFAWPATTAAPS